MILKHLKLIGELSTVLITFLVDSVEGFDSTLDILQSNFPFIPYSDKCIKLSAMCLICKDGTPGIFSHRLNNSDEQICIGASDQYISVCRKHYLDFKNLYFAAISFNFSFGQISIA